MRIAVATPPESDDLALLLAAQFEEHSIAFDDVALRVAIRGAVSQPSRGEFLLARDNRSLGLAYLAYVWTLEHGGLSAWLEELYVIPEARARGVGSRLLRSAMSHATAVGCAAIDLEVAADHSRAANLYARAGFRPHQRARWYVKL